MWISVPVALYFIAAGYVLFCAFSTAKQRRFYMLSLLSLALDLPFVALEMRINSMLGLFPRVVYLLHLVALGVQFQQLASIMHHHLFIYSSLMTSELYAPHGKRAHFMRGFASGSSTVYFFMLLLHLIVSPTQTLESTFDSPVYLPTLVVLIAWMSTMLSLCFLNYVRMVHRILHTLGETQRESKARLQCAATVCCIVFALKTMAILLLNYTDFSLPRGAAAAVYHWIPMLAPTLALAHVHRLNERGRPRVATIEFGAPPWRADPVELSS